MASKLQNKLQYDAKAAELRGLVEVEAKKLQKVLESRDSALRELQELRERESALGKELLEIKQEIIEAKELLASTIERKTKFINSAKVELVRERSAVKETTKELRELEKQLGELKSILQETNGFITKESDARIAYLETSRDLDKTKEEKEKITQEIKTEKEAFLAKQKELDAYHDYLKEFSGRLTQNLNNVKEATKYLNMSLEERGVPLAYGLPPDRITQIPFQ